MQTEFEATFYPIEKDEIRARLNAAGAKLEYPERLMRRVTFRMPESQQSMHRWARVRDEGDKITMSVKEARQGAEGKGLKLSLSVEGDGFQMTGDKGEIGDHVLRNLIDNAVNYTPSGSIDVSLKKAAGKYVFAVKDTGVGITPEDKARLFTEGGHGKESQKVNVHSTGYGLFIAKQVVDAHGGTISASSAGPGTGSTFLVELPVGS